MMKRLSVIGCVVLVVASGACGGDEAEQGAIESSKVAQEGKSHDEVTQNTEPPPPELAQPIPLWEHGKIQRQVDGTKASENGYLVVDLGEAFTPYLFTEGVDADGNVLTNAYRETYLALARGEFPDDHHGARAREDKYLELYGIVPTLSVLRKRIERISNLECAEELDLQPLIDFQGVVTYRSNPTARRFAREFKTLGDRVRTMMRQQGVDTPEALDRQRLDRRQNDSLDRYLKKAPTHAAIRALQKRLECEGFYKGRGRYLKGGLDWVTHEALAEFERRHRIYSWGYIGRDSLEVLRLQPLEAERRAVLRVLTERAIHAAGVLEDGSTSLLADDTPRTYTGMDGTKHTMPNFEGDLQERVVESFGLHTPESTAAFLNGLGDLPADGHLYVAIRGPAMPEYYSKNMDITLSYDRGDVWYDFPFDEEGQSRPQPVSRRPRVTVFVKYNGQQIPLARFGTTIGGWRPEKVVLEEPTEEDPEGLKAVMWKYKDSPVGPRVWQQIVAAPVWLPPATTPDRALLTRRSRRRRGESKYEINYHETGPSYASAYGLVAAYHRKYKELPEGGYAIGADEGIRTHGSVDYMSIMRRHSHGCHRLHNHIAVRLMSFVLKHRPHQRVGQQPVAYVREVMFEEEEFHMEINKGGYVFELAEPVEVNVLEGRIRGERKTPFEMAIPKYDEDVGAYLTADGRAVQLQGEELVEVELPGTDAGVVEDLFQDTLLTDGLPAVADGPATASPTSTTTTTTSTTTTTTATSASSTGTGTGATAAPAAGFPRYTPKHQLID